MLLYIQIRTMTKEKNYENKSEGNSKIQGRNKWNRV